MPGEVVKIGKQVLYIAVVYHFFSSRQCISQVSVPTSWARRDNSDTNMPQMYIKEGLIAYIEVVGQNCTLSVAATTPDMTEKQNIVHYHLAPSVVMSDVVRQN